MGLFSDKEIKNNEGAREPWKKSERDKALDEYFVGANPKQLGIKFKGAPKAFQNSILNKLKYNYKKPGQEDLPGRAERYEPFRRTSRQGKRFTPNEVDLIRAHQELKLDPEITAKILVRDVTEIDHSGKNKVNDARQLAPTLDLVLAYRYIYHVYKKKIVPNKTYDDLKEEEIEYGSGSKALAKESRDCPTYIKPLAMYLLEKHEQSL